MDGTHDKELARLVQEQTTRDELYLAELFRGGVLPEKGCFSAKKWGEFAGKDSDTIHDWIKKYDIPRIQPGSDVFIYAEDFHSCFKPTRPSEDAAKKRGGARKRKTKG